MSGRNVNIWTSNRVSTGPTPGESRVTMDVRAIWIDENGKEREESRSVAFPDCLDLLSDEAVREVIDDVLIRAMRKDAGIDTLVAVAK